MPGSFFARLRAGVCSTILATVLAMAAAPAAAQERVAFQVAGAEEALVDDLRAASLLVAAQDEGVTDPQELLAAAQADYGRLVGVLYASGRFGGVINILVDGREAAAIPPLAAPRAIARIEVRVQPGPVYRFGRARVAPLAPDTELPDGFATGQPAETPVIQDAADAAAEGWRQTGHAKVDVAAQQVVANHAADTLDADIRMAPGPVVRFGELRPKGYSRVRPDRIRRIAGLPTGEVYDPDAVQRAAVRLRRTQTFRSVALTEAETLGPGNTMDITATVDEELPRRFGFGAELSSVDGVTLSGFWLHRNLLGGAERLRIEGEIAQIGGSGEDYKLSSRFERPAAFGPDYDLYLLAEIEHLNEPTFTSDIATVGAGVTRIFSDELTAEAGIAYRYSRVEDASGVADYNLLTFPLGATYDRRDNRLDPARGYFADVNLTPFLGLAGSESGARLTFDTRAYRGFGSDDRFVLAGRVQGGSIVGASLTGVPNDYRFYTGGGGTVRGQEYQSLGVTLPGGTRSGGASYLAVSAEARIGLTNKFEAVAFADWGTVSLDAVPGSGGDSQSGAGLGLRYLTPIGPIRLDVATPVSGGASGSSVKIYVGIGQAF